MLMLAFANEYNVPHVLPDEWGFDWWAYVFGQDIYRIPDNRIVVKGQVEIVCLIDGRLGSSRLFDDLFSRYLKCDD